MKKFTLIILCFMLFGATYGQTDTEIAKSLLGKYFYEMIPTLDSLKVWHFVHYPEKINSNQKVITIANEKGSVKLFTCHLSEKQVIEKIVINYRHDSREQLEDLLQITYPDGKHVGKYSTDIEFKLR